MINRLACDSQPRSLFSTRSFCESQPRSIRPSRRLGLPWDSRSARATAPSCPLRRNNRSAPRLNRSDHRPHFRLRIRMQTDTVISVSVKVTQYGVVAQPWQTRVGIGKSGSGFFDPSLQGEQFWNPGERLVLAPRINVVGSLIAVVGFVARHGMVE